ncbi:zinc finger protein [Colletotrichum graminicola]|nr:zinc finger protein [Colletotrichum graminicola]
MEITDWIVSISDADALSDDQREMYRYFASLYKNSNKGIKGRGKDRRVSKRGAKSKAVPPILKDVCRLDSLAVYSSRQLHPPGQYTQQQQQHHRHGPVLKRKQPYIPRLD